MKVHPRHWTYFSNTWEFDDKKYCFARMQILDQVFTFKHALNEDRLQQFGSCLQSENQEQINNYFKVCYECFCMDEKNYHFKNILPLLEPTRTYSVMTTNTMEGIANANKHNSIRSRPPPESLQRTIHFINRQNNALIKNMSENSRDGIPQYVTTVAQNIMERIMSQRLEMSGSKVVWNLE